MPMALQEALEAYRANSVQAFRFDMSVSHEPLGSALGSPSGSVKSASEALSSIFGCDRSWITSMGSTTSNHVCMAYIGRMFPGKPVLVTANPHLSLVNSAVDFNVPLRFVPIEFEPAFELPVLPSAKLVKGCLGEFPDVAAIVVTSPTYEGLNADAESITHLVRQVHPNIPIFFDNAWGWGLDTPLAHGADVVVRSSHKMDGAWQGGGVLLAQEAHVDIDVLSQCVSARFSTSQSYPILASVEMCYGLWHHFGPTLSRCFSAWSDEIRTLLADAGIEVLDEDKISQFRDSGQVAFLDKRKITFSSKPKTGFELSEVIHETAHYIPEKAGISNVTLIASLKALSLDPTEVAENILKCIDAPFPEKTKDSNSPDRSPTNMMPPLCLNKWEELRVLEAHEAVRRETERVPLEEASDRIAAELITPYPPGIPIIIPGQRITDEGIEYIRLLCSLGGDVVAEDASMKEIRVVAS